MRTFKAILGICAYLLSVAAGSTCTPPGTSSETDPSAVPTYGTNPVAKDDCPLPDSQISYRVLDILDRRVYVDRVGQVTIATSQPTTVASLAEYHLDTLKSDQVFCNYHGTISGRNIAWIGSDGLHVLDIENHTEVYANPLLRSQSTWSECEGTTGISGLSAEYVLTESAEYCGGGNESGGFFAESVKDGELKSLAESGDNNHHRNPSVILHGAQAAVCGNYGVDPGGSPIHVVDLSTGAEQVITSPVIADPYPLQMTDTRLIWQATTSDIHTHIVTTTVWTADFQTLQPKVIDQVFSGADSFSDDYMLVSQSSPNGTTYELWTLADPAHLLRSLGELPVAPYFAGGMIVAPQTSDGPFTLIAPATDSRTTIPNPFKQQ